MRNLAAPLLVALLCFVSIGPVLAQTAPPDSVPAPDVPPRDPLLASTPEPRPINLVEAVELARRNSLIRVQARGRSRTASAAVRSAYGAYVPTLSITGGGTRQLPETSDRTRIENGQQIILTPGPWSYNTSISSSLQLFDGGRRLYELRQAHAEEDASETNESQQQFQAVLDAKQQYFNVLAWREAEAAAVAQLEQAEQQLKTAVLRVRAGSTTRSDSLRSVIQVFDARLTLSEARNNVVVANASLTRAVGSDVPVTAAAEDSTSLVGISVSEAELVKLVDRSPSVQLAEAEMDVASVGQKVARTGYIPTVNASYSYSGSGTERPFAFGTEDFDYNGALRLSFNIPIFDQFAREESVVRANVAKDNAEASLRDARLAAHQSLAQALADYRNAEERVFTQTATLSTADEDYRVQERRYQVGASTLLDLLASQTQVNQARQALIRARFDQRVAKAQLEALVGRSL
ncbi:MAG TPA: TolC family protein [Candidatus Eisenbacteria bacterium]|nr:TolC family protein [Candidatus Eisenbacteria bacterium]